MLESEQLFVRKAGEEIIEQLYNFEVGAGAWWVPLKWRPCPTPCDVHALCRAARSALLTPTHPLSVPAQQDGCSRRVALRPEIHSPP